MNAVLLMLTVLTTTHSPVPANALEPKSVIELWANFDPRNDPLQTEVVREWKSNGVVLRYVRFLIGTFKGKPARMAAFYGFPEGAKGKLPGVMHIHGGGQRASLDEVLFLTERGYAALSLNWGGREMEDAHPGDPNTDWGAVDPTQSNVAGYFSMLPGPKQYCEDRADPKNCNWYLLTLGCRRGLTFLEQQPEVDPKRLGIHGLSMGGNLVMYVAGTDKRVKAAVPAVGGQGWRWQPHAFIGGTEQMEHIQGDLDIFRRTLSFESCAPLIHCPVMHRSAANDFHGWMDDVYQTDALIKGEPVRHAWSPHLNHRLSPEVAVTMPLWFDHYLKGGPALPETPTSQLILKTVDGIPAMRVSPKSTWPIARCEIYYSVDPDPRARFWRSGEVERKGDVFTAKLPLSALDAPLFAFANVYYTLPKPESMAQLPEYRNLSIRDCCLSTTLHSVTPRSLQASSVRATEKAHMLIDDFSHGWRDWYRINKGNPDHWENWTRKITDPEWRGQEGVYLAVTLSVAKKNRMCFIVVENEWRSYRGPRKLFICEKDVSGNGTITLNLGDFKTEVGEQLTSWSQLDQLGLCAHAPCALRQWHGNEPEFLRVEWKKAE